MAFYYNQTVKDTLADLKVDPDQGLSSREVAKRQEAYGRNLLKVKETPLWKKLLEPFADIFMLILVAALILSAVQQDWIEVVAIAVIILADAIIYYIQRFSTDKILQSLKESTRQTIAVVRDGNESKRI